MTHKRNPRQESPPAAEAEALQDLLDAGSREHPGVMEMLRVYGGYEEHLRMVAEYERLLRSTRSATVAHTSG